MKLSNLPPDIILQILSHLPLSSLYPVFLTCASLSATIHTHRRSILRASLKVSLPGCLFKLVAAVAWARKRGTIKEDGELSAEEVEWMAVFHERVVERVMVGFGCAALAELEVESGKGLDAGLSECEKYRLMRGLYRFELCCALLSLREIKDMNEVWEVLKEKWEPWEIEEVLCVYQFAKLQAEATIKVTVRVLRERGVEEELPWLDGRSPLFRLVNPWERSFFVIGMASAGLAPLAKILFDLDSEDDLISFKGSNFTRRECFFLENELGQIQNDDLREKSLENMTFLGDDISLQLSRSNPPWAFTKICDETYPNHSGLKMPKRFRRSGYIFWDWQRLKGAGGDKIISGQLE